MKDLKLIFASILCMSMLCSCGAGTTKATPSPEPTLAVTDAPEATADADNADGGNDSVVDDMGDMAEDAGNAVGDAAKGVGDAVDDMVGNNDTSK